MNVLKRQKFVWMAFAETKMAALNVNVPKDMYTVDHQENAWMWMNVKKVAHAKMENALILPEASNANAQRRAIL